MTWRLPSLLRSEEKAGALLVFREQVFTVHRQQIVNFTATHRLPAIYGQQVFIEIGGLIVYAANFLDMLRRAGGYVDKILKGAKPRDLPIAYEEDAFRIAEAAKNPYSQISAYRLGGDLYLRKGDVDKAIRRLEEGLALSQALEIRELFPGVASLLGSAYACSARLSEGLALLEQAWEASNSMKVRRHLSAIVCSLSEARLLEARMDASADLARRALDLSKTHKERGTEARTLRLLGEIAARLEAPDGPKSERWYQEAIALAAELGMRPLVAHCHLGLGRLYRRTGKRAESEDHVQTVTSMYREMDMRFWLEKMEAEIRDVQ